MPKKISVGIIDFNPKRMNAGQAKQYGIPETYKSQLADFRQYPWAIGALLPDNALWFDPKRIW
ncbi:hypothetical protein KKA02_00100, partial [Patescibacteria group bacterium]|nr:hypothetical protein [Patescibacteria group bacterium]